MPAEEVFLCNVNDMRDQDMREFEVKGCDLAVSGTVLVVRDGDTFHAVGNKCTHFGAPLAKGSYCGGRVRCPWHGASFDVRTGDIEDYPGFDSLTKFTVSNGASLVGHLQTRVANNQVMLSIEQDSFVGNGCREKPLPLVLPVGEASLGAQQPVVVIVGGGGSAMTCASTLRQEGFVGRVLMVTQEAVHPYDRTKLSKVLDSPVDKLLIRPVAYFEKYNIEILLSTQAESVDVHRKRIKLSSDVNALHYDYLVLATGGSPRHLQCPGAIDANTGASTPIVYYLRTPDDALAIIRQAVAKHVVIVGTGFIGMELASSLIGKAQSVTVVGSGAVPLANVFGVDIGRAVQKMFVDKGVIFRHGGAVSIENNTLRTGDGENVVCDMVIAAIGVTPNTRFLRTAAVQLTDTGFVPVDKHMQTSVPGVYACGDITRFPLAMLGDGNDAHVNVQHWQMAMRQGRQVALEIVGRAPAMHTVPFFWSTMFGKSLRYAGYGAGYEHCHVSGNVNELKFCAYYCKNGVLRAVCTAQADPAAAHIANILRSLVVVPEAVVRACVGSETDDAQFWHEWMMTNCIPSHNTK